MKKKDCPSCVMRGVFKTFCQDPYRMDRDRRLKLWDYFDEMERKMIRIIPDSHWCETHRKALYWLPESLKEVETSEDTD